MKIYGITVGTTLPKPNWEQTDPSKGDYIKGKPDLSNVGGGSAGILVVTVDFEADEPTTDYSAAEIIAHIEKGGSAVLKLPGPGVLTTFAPLFSITGESVSFCEVLVLDGIVNNTAYTVTGNTCTTESYTVEEGASTEESEQLQANTEAIAGIQNSVTSWALTVEAQKYTLALTLEDGSTETHILETDANNYPTKLTVNGVEIPGTVTEV